MDYEVLLMEVKREIPPEEMLAVFSQPKCEYEENFLGYLEIYEAVRQVAPECSKIIDFGCYLAGQSYMFREYAKYIGVDVTEMRRFSPPNAEHHVCSVQEFIAAHPETTKDPGVFAVCAYANDDDVSRAVRENYKNCLVFL